MEVGAHSKTGAGDMEGEDMQEASLPQIGENVLGESDTEHFVQKQPKQKPNKLTFDFQNEKAKKFYPILAV